MPSSSSHPVPLFQVQNVVFAHSAEDREPLFPGLDLSLPQGALTMLRGPSGCGKSTLLRLLCRLEEPSSGRILFQNKSVTEYEPELLRNRAVFVHQEPALVPGTVEDNLRLPFGLAANRNTSAPSGDGLLRGLRELKLDIQLAADVSRLSGGQRMRVCLLRALLLSPKALLLDEPTAALDADSARVVKQMLEARVQDGTTVVMASHDAGMRDWACPHLEVDMAAAARGAA